MMMKPLKRVSLLRRKLLMMSALLPVLGLALPSFAKNALWAPARRAKFDYDLQGQWMGGVSGSGVLDWTYTPQNKAYAMDVKVSALLFSFLYASRGHYEEDVGILPASFREKRIGRDRTVFFDYLGKVLSYSWKRKSDTRPLGQGMQDAISVWMQMIYQMQAEEPVFQVGEKLVFPIARMGSVREWAFTVEGQATITVRSKSYEAWHVRWISPKKDENTVVDFWLAPSMGYWPVRILYKSGDGSNLTVELKKVRAFDA